MYIVKDHHCFPITEEALKRLASKANQGGCDNLLKYMSDLKWTRRHENVTRINTTDDIKCLEKENHIIILPPKIKMKEAVESYSKINEYYIEYMHWNNNGMFDGFIDHKKTCTY